MAKKRVTLSFDGHAIRMLVAQRDEVVAWEAVELAPAQMAHGLIADPAAVGEALAGLLAGQRLSRQAVTVGLTGHRTLSRILSLPPVRPSLLDEAVRHKARQEMALPTQDTYLSWQSLGQENGALRVYAFAVPRGLVDQLMLALRAAAVRPAALDLLPLAGARSAHRSEAIVVNLEEHGQGVVIVRRGIPVILRSVPSPAAGEELPQRLERLAAEIGRTVQFHNDGHREDILGPESVIYATGSLLESEANRSGLARLTPFPVQLPSPPLRLPEGFPLATYSANLGLAMKKVG
jgi:type IV pilus assembly protein PilM